MNHKAALVALAVVVDVGLYWAKPSSVFINSTMEESRMNDVAARVSVGPQIQLDDLAVLKAQGIEVVINNRPDGEVLDQPSHEAMAAASAALGLSYYFIPVSPRGLTQDNVDDMRAALAASSGPVFAYCRSGNRSGILLQAATQGGS